LTATPNGYAIGVGGPIVDWLVIMRRLDEGQTLEVALRDRNISGPASSLERHLKPILLACFPDHDQSGQLCSRPARIHSCRPAYPTRPRIRSAPRHRRANCQCPILLPPATGRSAG